MFLQVRKLFFIRFILILALAVGIINTGSADQVQAASPAQQVSTETQACIPGTGWQWTYGPSRPDLAGQAEVALKNQGIDSTVAANEYGEKDSCGNFELFSVDFTVTLRGSSAPQQLQTVQADFSDSIIATLAQFGEPQLGNVRIDSGSGTPKTYVSSSDIQALSEKTASTPSISATTPVTRKAFLLVYNPVLSNGQDLITYMGWMPVASMSQGIINSFLTSSQGALQYTIAQQVIANEWPAKVDGFRYTETTYFQVWQNPSLAHNPSEANYDLIIDQYDICGKFNRGEIDELWMVGAPHFGFYESTLVGPGGYLYNAPPLTQTHGCDKLMPIMGLSYERGIGEAVHSFGHRVEATMTKIYGGWQENRTAHNWDRFGLVKAQSPNYSYSGCGSIHYTPSSLIAYEYDPPYNTLSNCEDFRNYPNLSDPLVVAQPVNCTAWNCTHLGYMEWWFNHLPTAAGCGPDTFANDWWPYFLDPSLALNPTANCPNPPPPPTCPTITNWKGEYWNNALFLGSPVLCRDDVNINFDWGAAGPGGPVGADNFAARWTRTVNFTSGVYRFSMINDDGARLYVDDVMKIDAWASCCTWSQTDVPLSAGNHHLRMDMFENAGGATAKLQWQRIGDLPTATPTATSTFTATPTSSPTTPPAVSSNPLYISLTSSQPLGGVASADEDILKFDGTNWSLFFDGSDVGVGSVDLAAFSLLDADTILMSFSANVTVNGITATHQDILQFDATSLGGTTAGTFSMYFDGSDVGFDDATNEKIDAISRAPDGRLLISTTGNPVVPGVSGGRDEDILGFASTSLGDVTSGTWALYFDGSDVGLGETSGEDIDALYVRGEAIYLSTADVFTVNGLSGADEDVFVCAVSSLGDVTTCNYWPSLYFDGSTWGLDANDVDGFNYLSSGATPTSTPTPTATSSGLPPATNTPTMTPTSGAPGILTFSAIADARVVQTSPTTNYGTATTLQVDGDAGAAQTSFIRFEASGLSGPVQSAKLRIFCTTNGTGNGPIAYLANSTWTESSGGGVNWNTQPALASGPLDNKAAIGTNTWSEYDVTASITGNGSYTFALVADSSDGIVFSSREGTTPPQLVITLGSGGFTSTPIPTSTVGSPATNTPTPTATQPPVVTNTLTPTPTSTVGTPATSTPTPTPTATSTQTTSTSTFTFVPTIDVYVDANNPTTNYSSQTSLRVDGSPIVRSYFQFDIWALSGNVTRATLLVYANSASSTGFTVHSVSDNMWFELIINYNNAPPMGSALGSSGPFTAGTLTRIDVTSYITGNGIYSIGLTTSNNTAISLASSESATNKPQLIIETTP